VLILCVFLLGGALATLCSADFSTDPDFDSLGVCLQTFGQPRVGNSVFRSAINRQLDGDYDRFVNYYRTRFRIRAQDLITRLPPRSLGYRHAGTLRAVKKEALVVESGVVWWCVEAEMRRREKQ
jgi:hypothetical protein